MDLLITENGKSKAPLACKRNPRSPLNPTLAALSLERYTHLYGCLTAIRNKQTTEQSVDKGHGYPKSYELKEILKLHGLSSFGINKTEMLQRISSLELFNPYRCTESASKTRPVFEQAEIEQDLMALDWLEGTCQVEIIKPSPNGVIFNFNENPTAMKTSSITTTLLLPPANEFPMLNERQALTKKYEPFSQASVCKEIINLNHQYSFQASPIMQNDGAISLQEISKSVTVPQPKSASRSKSLKSHRKTHLSFLNSLKKQRKRISVLHRYKALKAEINRNAWQRDKNVSPKTDSLHVERRENA